jgi:predicted O-methyltransferase YrrM
LPIIGRLKGRVLSSEVEKHRPKRVLEVGTCVGYSTILMAKGLPPGGKIICCEISPEFAREARRNLKEAGLASRVTVKTGDAKKLIPKLSGKFDMVFLDAVKEDYLLYLRLVEKKLAPGAVVAADNVTKFRRQVQDYLDYVRAGGGYKSKIHDFGFDAVEVSVRK